MPTGLTVATVKRTARLVVRRGVADNADQSDHECGDDELALTDPDGTDWPAGLASRGGGEGTPSPPARNLIYFIDIVNCVLS